MPDITKEDMIERVAKISLFIIIVLLAIKLFSNIPWSGIIVAFVLGEIFIIIGAWLGYKYQDKLHTEQGQTWMNRFFGFIGACLLIFSISQFILGVQDTAAYIDGAIGVYLLVYFLKNEDII